MTMLCFLCGLQSVDIHRVIRAVFLILLGVQWLEAFQVSDEKVQLWKIVVYIHQARII